MPHKVPVLGSCGRDMEVLPGKRHVKVEGDDGSTSQDTFLALCGTAHSRPFLQCQLLLSGSSSPISKPELQSGALAAKDNIPPVHLKLCSARQQRGHKSPSKTPCYWVKT